MLKKYLGKSLLVIIGCFIISIGVDFYLKSNIGGDSMTAFFDGFYKSFNIKQGYTTLLINLVFVLLTLFVNYRKIGIGTIIIVFGYGIVLNFILSVSIIPVSPNIFASLLYCLIGVFLVALAIAIWILVDFGASPVEGFAKAISEKTKIKFWVLKVGIDLILLVSGILLKGALGIGTIITSLLVGPTINVIVNVYQRKKQL